MLRIIFMGTPDFAVPSLERLVEGGYPPLAVVTGPDRARGRGLKTTPTPVKVAAERLGVEHILQPESVRDPSFAAEIASLKPDVMVVVAFRILPPEVFTQARLGTFNLHGSLLPRYRGAAPIHRAVMAGETETGVTTFFLQEQVDTGNMILQRPMSIGPEETTGEVHDRMMMLGADVVLETVQMIERGAVNPVPQDEAQASPAPKIFRDDARIPWARPAAEVHNHIRGLSPHPGAWSLWGDRVIKLYRSRVSAGEGTAGEIVDADSRLCIACGSGAVEVLELQMEGKRRVSAEEFLRGQSLAAGTRLE